MTVIYIGPRSCEKWFKFLLATLLTVDGVGRVLHFNYQKRDWSREENVVFFDLSEAPMNWPELVYHLARLGNRVIVMDVSITAINALKAGQAGAILVFDRTTKPERVRSAYRRATEAQVSPWLNRMKEV